MKTSADYDLESKYPGFETFPARNLVARRQAGLRRRAPGWARGVGRYLAFADAISRLGEGRDSGERYGNLFGRYEGHRLRTVHRCRCARPAVHYTMGGYGVWTKT